jgi:hypothetical protein
MLCQPNSSIKRTHKAPAPGKGVAINKNGQINWP